MLDVLMGKKSLHSISTELYLFIFWSKNSFNRFKNLFNRPRSIDLRRVEHDSKFKIKKGR